MSSRVTRSATKLAAGSSSAAATPPNNSTVSQPPSKSRKRKADRDPSPEDTAASAKVPPAQRAKRPKIATEEPPTPVAPKPSRKSTKQPANMAKPE